MSLAEVFPLTASAVLSVLIVEDERKMRGRLVDQVRRFGLEPFQASTGFEAIRAVGEKRPDLILLDGLLPNMHGFEVSRVIRRIDSSYRARVVLMTSIYKNVRYQNDARLRYGIDEYVIKPLADDTLARLLGRGGAA